MFITRVRLEGSTCSAISAATFGSVFIKKCVAPIRIFNVPNGCSTVSRRVRIASGFFSRRAFMVSQKCLWLPPLEAALRSLRACSFQRPGAAHVGPVVAQDQSISLIREVVEEPL